MKNAVIGFLKWQAHTCIIFTVSTAVYTLISLCFGASVLEMGTVASLFIISFCGSFLQYLSFSNYIVKRMRYSFRLLLFAVPFFAVMAACAVIFRWFPAGYILSWVIFTGIFLLLLIAATLVFELYYQAAGKRYNGLLGQYKKNRAAEKK